MSVHKNMFVKRMGYSLVFGLFLVSLFVPVYAPARRPDYIEWMPVVPVADVSLDYQDVIVRSLTTAGAGWGGGYAFVGEPGQKSIIIDVISAGLVSITWTTSGSVGNFAQQFSLNIVNADDIRTGDPLGVSGRSNLTISTTEGRVTFNCIVYGNATFTDVGPLDYVVELELSLRGTSSLGPVISLQIQGTLTFPDWDLILTAEGQILSFSRFSGNF